MLTHYYPSSYYCKGDQHDRLWWDSERTGHVQINGFTKPCIFLEKDAWVSAIRAEHLQPKYQGLRLLEIGTVVPVLAAPLHSYCKQALPHSQ